MEANYEKFVAIVGSAEAAGELFVSTIPAQGQTPDASERFRERGVRIYRLYMQVK